MSGFRFRVTLTYVSEFIQHYDSRCVYEAAPDSDTLPTVCEDCVETINPE